MRLYCPIAKVDAEQRMVWGYASTGARDDQGETITLPALEAALGDYMKFANIREMHQPSAVGVAKEAAVDDKGLFIGAKVVDPLAWQKVREGVYKGFSIGGRVIERNPGDRSQITSLALSEISLVDRPANPEAIFDCWKRSEAQMAHAPEPFNALPLQVWHCGEAAHRHLKKDEALACVAKRAQGAPAAALDLVLDQLQKGGEPGGAVAKEGGDKPYGDVEYADPGYRDDKKRYPVDTERHIRAAWSYIHKPKNRAPYSAEQLANIEAKIVAAWKDKIDAKGPPEAGAKTKANRAAVAKALEDIGEVAWLLRCLDRMKERLEDEAALEGDQSPQPAKLAGIIGELVDFLKALAEEETAELIAGDEIDPDQGDTPSAVARAAKGGDVQKRSEADQHLMDMAHAAVHKALGMDGMTAPERGHMVEAKEALKAAGGGEDGGASEHATTDTARNPAHPAPSTGAGDPTAKALELIELALGKRSQGHQHLMDMAHACVTKLLDGEDRHPRATRDHLHKAKYHLEAAGAGKTPGDDAAKRSAGTADLAKAVGEALAPLASRLEALAGDVAAIKATPLPALTARSAEGLARVEKGGGDGSPGISDAEVRAVLDQMSEEERSLALIKAARQLPYRMRHSG